ncbi:MAG: hypothetical protein ACFHHU_08330 [Porticoccaceae bacterium]
MACVFGFAAFMWITRGFIWSGLVPEIRDGMIAVLAAVLLFLIPAKSGISSRILDWKDSPKNPLGHSFIVWRRFGDSRRFQGDRLVYLDGRAIDRSGRPAHAADHQLRYTDDSVPR